MDLGCQEVYRRENEVIKIAVAIRMARNDFRDGRTNDANLLLLTFEGVRFFYFTCLQTIQTGKLLHPSPQVILGAQGGSF